MTENIRPLLEQRLSHEKNLFRKHIILTVMYGIVLCIFLIWGILFFSKNGYSYLFWIYCGLFCLPAVGLGLEINQLVKKRELIAGIEQYLNLNDDEICENREIERLINDIPPEPNNSIAGGTFNRILVQVLTGVLMVCVSHYQSSLRHSRQTSVTTKEPSIPVMPTDISSLVPDEIVTHRVVSGSAGQYTDEPKHTRAKDWMANLEILPQVLYEDANFKLEITGTKLKRESLYIYTLFSNNSDHNVSAGNKYDSSYINRQKESLYFRAGSSSHPVKPGMTEEGSIAVSSYDIPWYDLLLEELTFILEVTNEDASANGSEDELLLETAPLSIRPTPVEGSGNETQPVMENGASVLFENNELRVLSTGLYEILSLKDGKPTAMSHTYWELVIDNKTSHDVTIVDADCVINGRNALLFYEPDEIYDTIPAGTKKRVTFFLYGAVPDLESQSKKIGSIMELTSALRWPLDQIREGSLAFTMNYTDSEGQQQSIPIKDEFISGNPGSTAEKMAEAESHG